jgi:tRNA(Ile)-lysidine synthase
VESADHASTGERRDDRLAEREFVRQGDSIEFACATLAALPKAVARRLIRRAIQDAKGDLRQVELHHIDRILELPRHVSLPSLNVTQSFGLLRFERPSAPPVAIPVTQPGAYPSPDGLTQICVEAPQSKPCVTLKLEENQFCPPLQLRGWRPGDHYRPQGRSRDLKIQEMFQKARVPSWRRASWPILTSEDKIVWSRQFGLAAGCDLLVRES